MPHVNAQGKIAHGVGSAGAFLDNVTFDTGGKAQWFDAQTIVYEHEGPGSDDDYVALYHVDTTVIDQAADWEADRIYGSKNGVWAAENNDEHDDARIGLFSSGSFQLPEAGLLGVGPEGSIVYRPNHSGTGARVRELSGSDYELTNGPAEDVYLIGRGQAVWLESGVLKTKGMPALTVLLGTIDAPKVVAAGGKWWIGYQSASGIVLHPSDSVLGFQPVTGTARFDMVVLSGQPDVIRVAWSTDAGDTAVQHVDLNVKTGTLIPLGTPAPIIPETGGTEGAAPKTGEGTIILTSTAEFGVAAAAEELVTLPIDIFPAFPSESGFGRIVHPLLGAFDYEVKPDEWVNIDADAIIAPVWASSRTLTSAANVLWNGNLRDVVIEERWKALGGLAMPATQLRMLLAIWTTPVDPDVGYVHWHPNYITPVAFKVLPVGLTAGGQGITFDDVINYKDENGDPIGWMTAPVTFQLKLVERVETALPVATRMRRR